MMLRIGICDDESVMRKELCKMISWYMEEKENRSYQISQFESGELLLNSNGDLDLIFLDIQMEHPDGMETARRLRQRRNQSLLVFVTVLKENVFDAFEVEAYDYLLKPLEKERFVRTMDRAVRALDQQTDQNLIIQKGNTLQMIPLSLVMYCEVIGRKIYIHQKNGEVTEYYDKMEKLENRVGERFFRCHRSYLVNLDYVQGCKAGQVLLPAEEKIPVSRLREKELAQALLRHMKTGLLPYRI